MLCVWLGVLLCFWPFVWLYMSLLYLIANISFVTLYNDLHRLLTKCDYLCLRCVCCAIYNIHIYICVAGCLAVCLAACVAVCLFECQAVCLFVCLRVCLPICMLVLYFSFFYTIDRKFNMTYIYIYQPITGLPTVKGQLALYCGTILRQYVESPIQIHGWSNLFP